LSLLNHYFKKHTLTSNQIIMKLFVKAAFIASALFLSTGCASIVSTSRWPFSVDTEPQGADVSIINARNEQVFSGRTPCAMILRSGNGFFGKQHYTVTIKMDGYETKIVNINCKLNGWYFGNILIGGVVGMLFVDPATGAMYKLSSDGINETLKRSSATTGIGTQRSLQVLDKNKLSPQQQAQLVLISK